MGYHVTQGDTEFRIKRENLQAALTAAKDMHRNYSSVYFAWVDEAEVLNSTSLEDVFHYWRWDAYFEEETGDITEVQFFGEKAGDDEYLFEAIAPYVEKGSYITMQGEDGHLWRWFFDGEKVVYQTADITWK